MELMPLFRGLTEDESYSLIHKLKNQVGENGDKFTECILTDYTYQFTEKALAKISEEENYLAKNRYRLDKTKLDYADKKRMPIDAKKVKDLLRNKPAFTAKIREEIQNYEQDRENPQFQHGILSYLNEAAWGEMRDLLNDIGVKNENIPFANVGDYQKRRDSEYIHQSDH